MSKGDPMMSRGEKPTALAEFKKHFAGRTQRDIAKELGVTPAYVNDLMHGRRNLTARLCKLLGERDGQWIFWLAWGEAGQRAWDEV